MLQRNQAKPLFRIPNLHRHFIIIILFFIINHLRCHPKYLMMNAIPCSGDISMPQNTNGNNIVIGHRPNIRQSACAYMPSSCADCLRWDLNHRKERSAHNHQPAKNNGCSLITKYVRYASHAAITIQSNPKPSTSIHKYPQRIVCANIDM